jgi:hypothetical protein
MDNNEVSSSLLIRQGVEYELVTEREVYNVRRVGELAADLDSEPPMFVLSLT